MCSFFDLSRKSVWCLFQRLWWRWLLFALISGLFVTVGPFIWFLPFYNSSRAYFGLLFDHQWLESLPFVLIRGLFVTIGSFNRFDSICNWSCVHIGCCSWIFPIGDWSSLQNLTLRTGCFDSLLSCIHEPVHVRRLSINFYCLYLKIKLRIYSLWLLTCT